MLRTQLSPGKVPGLLDWWTPHSGMSSEDFVDATSRALWCAEEKEWSCHLIVSLGSL